MNYSVLMSVYQNDNPEYFQEAIESMLDQTVKTNDFVIVCDGPLTDELNDVLKKYEIDDLFNIIRLEQNVGLGNALNAALPMCKNELVARMDSDDISINNRCEEQIKVFQEEDVDIVSGTVDEYTLDMKTMTGSRILPQNHEGILKYSKRRSPFNHPAVMFKKSAVLKAGGYQHFYLREDYYLWIRMIQTGAKGYNIQESILKMRADLNMIKRRGGYKYFKSAKKFHKYLLKSKYINLHTYITNIMINFTSQVLMPKRIRVFFYNKFLRKQK